MMNRNKRPLPKRTQKKMQKEIRLSQNTPSTREGRQYMDELTAKELAKKYPRKKKRTLPLTKKVVTAKKSTKGKGVSKRTTPGTVSSHSAPAHVHSEGTRWIKTLTKQAKTQRTVQTRHSSKKK